ncbi:lantibiotic dehydratase [Streptomyces palmae]|uniref:Lantibiotic dehydratase N-terminal domain-containing protein n=1 Tax=Streptomyces palmae TaxID=1701085 RepID=A0A4Z0HGH2_9ACTN|nr:lantibiotic dehydratase [Streptomyces palmae]TGB16628.1 hypothetical protein E4099_05045 [Streptomyces palmae]
MPSTFLSVTPQVPDPAEEADRDPMAWILVPRFLLRVGGLPFDTATRLTAPRTAAWADELLDGEEALKECGARLADTLQERVAQSLDDAAARRTLINLRRAVFNGRTPKGLDAAAELLPPADVEALRHWAAERERLAALRAAGEAIRAEEAATARAELRRITAESDLRHGIQLSSPTLDGYLDDYLRRPADAKLSKRERRLERSLLEYLYRTACKTSPFSTLTAVALGSFTSDPRRPAEAPALSAEARGWHKHSTTRLNMAVLARISELLAGDPDIRRDLPVRLTGGLEIGPERVRYLRKLRNSDNVATDAAVSLEAVHERLFYLPSGEVLAEVLELFADGATRRFGEAVRALSDPAAGRPAEDIENYLAQLLRLGLLVVPELHLDIHDPEPVRSYRDGLRALGTDWGDHIADLVARMDADTAAFADADPAGRRALLSGIEDTVRQAHERLGHADAPVLRTLLYEDTTLPGLTVTGDARQWTERLTPGLRQLARILPAFDTNLVRRLVTKGYFTVRFGKGGRCEDFLAFAHDFGQDLWDNYSQRLLRHRRFTGTTPRQYDNWFRQPEITGIDRARAAVAQEIARRHAERGGPDQDLVLDEEFLAAVEEELPQPGGIQPLSFFLQLADDGRGDPTLVVNRVYSGLTLLFSRFAHCFDDTLTESLRGALDAVVPSDAVFAELKGGYDTTNLNLHPSVTRYEIVCPGETSFRPEAEQIPVEDLVIEHDLEADRLRLRSRRLGVEVIPVYLGFLLPMALPEIQQVLLNFSYTSMAPLDLWEGTGLLPDTTTAAEDAGGESAEESRVTFLPRIRLGEVVVQRASWHAPADRLPPAVPGQSEAELFTAWRAWQRAAGLPRYVFASLGGEHKPQYVDFDSYLSVNLLETAVRRSASAVVFSEMLPGPEQLWLRDGWHRYVTELTVELDGIRTER